MKGKADEAIELIQALKKGKTLECRTSHKGGSWRTVTDFSDLYWLLFEERDIRIKPELGPAEWTLERWELAHIGGDILYRRTFSSRRHAEIVRKFEADPTQWVIRRLVVVDDEEE